MREGTGDRSLDIGAFPEGKMDRDRRRGFLHRYRYTMIAHQEAYLLVQIMVEQIGPRDVCGIIAGRRNMAIGQTRIHMRETRRGQADFGIVGAITLRRNLTACNLLERIAQEGRIAVIEFCRAATAAPASLKTSGSTVGGVLISVRNGCSIRCVMA